VDDPIEPLVGKAASTGGRFRLHVRLPVC
jgi:hypothetical protein